MPFVRWRCQGTPGMSGEVSSSGVELQRVHRAVGTTGGTATFQEGVGAAWISSWTWVGDVELLHNRKETKQSTVLGCLWEYSIRGVITMLVSAQLEPGVRFEVLLFKKAPSTLEVERREVKMTRDPEDVPPGIKLEGCFACRRAACWGAGGRQADFQAQVALNRLLWRGGQ